MPPAFADAPTDADYAMELISQRVAAGLDVKPPRPRRSNKKKNPAAAANDPDPIKREDTHSQPDARDKSVDWKKWGERAAIGKAWAEDGKRLMTGNQVCASSFIASGFCDDGVLLIP